MKRSELKKAFRPLIKDCIKEVIFEEGILSNIVSEVVQGLGSNMLVASKQHVAPPVQQDEREQHRQREQEMARQKIQETRKKMLDAVGSDSYNGVDLFEGTAPAAQGSQSQAALSGVDPNDAGVNIDKIFGGISENWSRMIK